jgi:hypothetical protein
VKKESQRNSIFSSFDFSNVKGKNRTKILHATGIIIVGLISSSMLNSNAITDGNKVNEVVDKFRSEFMVLRSPVSCFDALLQALG